MNDLSKYHELKHLIRSGDCLQCRGNHLSSQIIMAASGPWSHSALVIEMADRLWVVEAVPPRVRMVSLRVFLEDYPGEVWWFRIDGPFKGAVFALKDYALHHAEQGTRYDFKGLFLNVFGPVPLDFDSLWCSEFVQAAYYHGKFIDKPLYGATPTDISGYSIFEPEPVMLVKQELPMPEGWPV